MEFYYYLQFFILIPFCFLIQFSRSNTLVVIVKYKNPENEKCVAVFTDCLKISYLDNESNEKLKQVKNEKEMINFLKENEPIQRYDEGKTIDTGRFLVPIVGPDIVRKKYETENTEQPIDTVQAVAEILQRLTKTFGKSQMYYIIDKKDASVWQVVVPGQNLRVNRVTHHNVITTATGGKNGNIAKTARNALNHFELFTGIRAQLDETTLREKVQEAFNKAFEVTQKIGIAVLTKQSTGYIINENGQQKVVKSSPAVKSSKLFYEHVSGFPEEYKEMDEEEQKFEEQSSSQIGSTSLKLIEAGYFLGGSMIAGAGAAGLATSKSLAATKGASTVMTAASEKSATAIDLLKTAESAATTSTSIISGSKTETIMEKSATTGSKKAMKEAKTEATMIVEGAAENTANKMGMQSEGTVEEAIGKTTGSLWKMSKFKMLSATDQDMEFTRRIELPKRMARKKFIGRYAAVSGWEFIPLEKKEEKFYDQIDMTEQKVTKKTRAANGWIFVPKQEEDEKEKTRAWIFVP